MLIFIRVQYEASINWLIKIKEWLKKAYSQKVTELILEAVMMISAVHSFRKTPYE